jgi:hypothetical protein
MSVKKFKRWEILWIISKDRKLEKTEEKEREIDRRRIITGDKVASKARKFKAKSAENVGWRN